MTNTEQKTNNNPSLQEQFLAKIRNDKVPVSIYLVNGIKLQGTIHTFDDNVIALKDPVPQIVYKHNICTILPSKYVDLSQEKT